MGGNGDYKGSGDSGACEKGASEIFEAPSLMTFIKKVLFSYNVLYSSSYQQANAPIRATPDIYMIAIKSLDKKGLVEWKGHMDTEYTMEEFGPYPYLKGDIRYRGTTKFSDETIELETDYSSTLMPFWVDQFLNVLSSAGIGLPHLGYDAIKGLRGSIDVSNKLKSAEPLTMDMAYSSETVIKLGDDEVVVRRSKSSDNSFVVRHAGMDRELKDDEMADMESTLFKGYVSQSNTGRGKPRMKVNGSPVDATEYFDKLVSSSLGEAVYKDLRTVKEKYREAKRGSDEIEGKITELRYKLDNLKTSSPSSKESIKRLDSALLAKEKEKEQYDALLITYGNVLVMASDSIKSSMRRAGMRNAYSMYEEASRDVLKGDFVAEVMEDLAKYKKGKSIFQLG